MYNSGTATGCDVGFSVCGAFRAFRRCGCYLEHYEVNNMGGMSYTGACLTYILLSVRPVGKKKSNNSKGTIFTTTQFP